MIEIQGYDKLSQRLERCAAQVGYLTVRDRSDRRRSDSLGRFDLTAEQAQAYSAVEVHAHGYTITDGAQEWTQLEIVQVALRWLRDVIQDNSVASAVSRYRVTAYRPKAERTVFTLTLVARDPDYEEELLAYGGDAGSMAEATERANIHAYADLGVQYARFAELLLTSIGGLQNVSNKTIDRLGQQNADKDDSLQDLVAALLTDKVEMLKLQNAQSIDERIAQGRADVAKSAVNTLERLGQAYMVSQGLTPEAAAIIDRLGTNPKLMAALEDPEVRELLEDPESLDDLAAFLRAVAAQQAAKKQAQSQQTSAEETPADPAEGAAPPP